MLLRDYILLNLGPSPRSEMRSWQQDMIKRRQAEACRDLLACWRPTDEEGTVVALPVVGQQRFGGELSEAAFRAGLEQVLRQTLTNYLPDADGLTGLGGVQTQSEGGVAWGEVAVDLGAVQGRFGVAPDHRAVSHALAYFFEQVFAYAPAAQHPVAFEESLRPAEGV